eukprot:5402284-Amphidinium_carterae.1
MNKSNHSSCRAAGAASAADAVATRKVCARRKSRAAQLTTIVAMCTHAFRCTSLAFVAPMAHLIRVLSICSRITAVVEKSIGRCIFA